MYFRTLVDEKSKKDRGVDKTSNKMKRRREISKSELYIYIPITCKHSI